MSEVAAPAAVAAPQSASAIMNADDATFAQMFGLDDVRADETSPEVESEATADDAAEGTIRDERGRFVKREATEEGDVTGEEDLAEPEPEEEPAPTRTPLAQFKAYDKEGELDIPMDLEIEFKADGEMRKLPLDKIIRHAQNGVYNERLVNEVQQARETLPQIQQQMQAMQENLQAQVALNARLLQDENYFLESRERFLQEQTPEVQLQKMRQHMHQQQEMQRQSEDARQSVDFVDRGLTPRMEQMLEQYPEVSWEEAFGRFSLVVAPLMEAGRVPAHRFNEVMALLDRDIGPWVAQRAEGRRTTNTRVKQERDSELRRAAETATKAKRTLARALSPVAGRIAPDKVRAKPVTTADEGMDALIASIATQGI
jgi:hypothetical protein